MVMVFASHQMMAQSDTSAVGDSIAVITTLEPKIDTVVATSAIQSLVNQGIDLYQQFSEEGSSDDAKLQSAIGYFEQALAEEPKHHEANVNLSRVYENEAARLMASFNTDRASLDAEGQKQLEQRIYKYMELAEKYKAATQ